MSRQTSMDEGTPRLSGSHLTAKLDAMLAARVSARVDPQVDAWGDSIAEWMFTEVDKRLDMKIDAAIADRLDRARIDHAVETRVVDKVDHLLDAAGDAMMDLITICIDDSIRQSIAQLVDNHIGTQIASLINVRIDSLSDRYFDYWLESRDLLTIVSPDRIVRRVFERIDAYIETRTSWIDDRIRERIDDQIHHL